jgi:rod shape-determining protein MreC
MRVSRLITSRRLFILLASVILLIVVAGLTLRGKTQSASWPRKVVMDVENTVSGWIYTPVSKVTSFLAGVHNLHEMYVENSRLKAEMQNYSALQAKLQDEESKNAQLNQMLKFKQYSASSQLQYVPAHVIGRDPAQWSSVLTIDVGRADGVYNNMAVISSDGSLVGRVAVAANYSAKVVLITDTQIGDGVSAKVQNQTPRQPFGVVAGSTTVKNQLEMTFISPIALVKPGDTVVTSGLGNIFPEGIVIGQVEGTKPGLQGLTQSATIKPAADLGYLQDVFVVSKKGAH